MIDLRKGDCLEQMRNIQDKSVNLVLIDPPYNIKKDKKWDNRKTSDYISFMGEVFAEISRVLVDNGSLYFFHNDLPLIAQLMEWLRKNSDFAFNSFIVCNRGNFRKFIWNNPNRENGNNLRSWFNVCEYCLYYTKADADKRTGLERVMLDVNNFQTLRKYAHDMLCFIGGGKYVYAKYINEQLGHRKAEHFCYAEKRSVMHDIGGKVDYFTRYGSTQWDLCTEETYNELIKKFHIDEWEGFRTYESLREEYESLREEYESLREEYESLRPVHNLDAEHSNLWCMKRDKGENYHPCQKPIDILERIIRCSTNPGMVVLDCFMGSGSTGVACVNTGRSFVGIEMDDHYFEVAKNRIEEAEAALAQNTGAFLV